MCDGWLKHIRSQLRALPGGRSSRCGRAAVVVMLGLERDRRRAAKRLQIRNDAKNLLIVEADRRLVDGRHRWRKSLYDVGGRFVHRLGEVLDVAQPRYPRLRPAVDPGEIGESKRSGGLPDRVAREAESFGFHDLPADHGHVGRGHIASNGGIHRRLHFLLRHHLPDVGIEPRGREDESADSDDVRHPHEASSGFGLCVPATRRGGVGDGGPEPSGTRVRRSKSGLSCRLEIQNTTPIRRKNMSTVADTTFVAKPSVGVNASTDRSRTTP